MFRGMWHLPGPGIEPMSPTLAGGFLSPVSPRASYGCALEVGGWRVKLGGRRVHLEVGRVRGRDRENVSSAGTAGHPASLESPYPSVFMLHLSPPHGHKGGSPQPLKVPQRGHSMSK